MPYDSNNVTLVFEDEINSLENMFYGLINLIKIDLSKFDTSKVTSMKSMFRECENLSQINFGEIETSSVTDMSYLFYKCSKLSSINVSSFDTSSVTNMNAMFSECASLTSIDATNFNTPNLEEMYDLFSYDRQLVFVDISNFDTSKVRNMQGIFYCCEKLQYLDLRNFDASSVTNFQYVFGFCKNLIFLNLRKFKIINTGDVALHETFHEISSYTKYCIEDSNTKYYLIQNKVSDCSYLCFQKNIKVDTANDICYCNENYKFEFIKKCYDECPGNNEGFDGDKNICEGPVPDNYYLDDDDMYRKCYELCKKCDTSGDEINNNCSECVDGFKFLNDSLANPNNCYQICEFFYYFNETNQYVCTPSNFCPSKYSKLIIKKSKCIDDCKKDEEYNYEYNNTCLKECPENTKIYEEEKLCLEECYSNQFEFNNICYNDCPEGKFKIFQNRNKCIDTIPENYYLDNDGIYKECFETCKKCNE